MGKQGLAMYKSKGVTLVELVLTIAILGIALSGIMLAYVINVRYSASPIITAQAISIAKGYLEEVYSKDFPVTLPCPAPPANRSDYTNVCDYQGMVNNGVINQNGASVPSLQNYSILVNIVTSGFSFSGLTPGTDVVRIDVTVSHASIPNFVLSAYRTNF